MAADWLTREIGRGLQALIVLRLEGAPAADAVGPLLDVWVTALSRRRQWSETRDAPRIRHGFALLAGRMTRWPAPAHLIESLPEPEQQTALPRPARLTDVGREELEKIRELAASALRRMPEPEPQDYEGGR